MICTECASIMVKTPSGGGRCSMCGHVTDEPYQPLSVFDLGVGGVAILDEELGKANARIAELEGDVGTLRALYKSDMEGLGHSWRAATGCNTPAEAGEGRAFDRALSRQQELARLREAEIPVALCWFLRWVLDEDERRALRERWRTVTSWLASLAGMDRVPCRHYRECGCREVLDRERVMRMIVDLRDAPGFRGLAGKL